MKNNEIQKRQHARETILRATQVLGTSLYEAADELQGQWLALKDTYHGVGAEDTEAYFQQISACGVQIQEHVDRIASLAVHSDKASRGEQ
ncbi:hypothetical protein [Photobacterium sanguinicancri]|uniref:hypothetical protein n=1 Tax=Photobacterium sanguinicancri TaxID=875932 RepID=UPI000787C2FD|nr:hypothetical protein [Photobacterium sanguinicancri]KXI22262.1 hypothetical protein AS132_15250 [Photobacterium sanguinicancri]